MKVDPNIALSETGFLFHASMGDSYSVNPTGLRIIQLIREGKTVQEVVATLTEEFDVAAEQAEEDVQDFLPYLQQLKILIHA
ncbi:MAG: HPr-rel-A system PqqD family peptide chaperone [Lewinella sp.]|nr:HPr-rel-A system PqqD family peptide chaperone [Lewinella sp.]